MGIVAIAILAVAALAQQAPQFNPEVLKWQAESQARERTINRQADRQLSRASKPAAAARPSASKPTRVRRKLPK
jgi:hypothetical protein